MEVNNVPITNKMQYYKNLSVLSPSKNHEKILKRDIEFEEQCDSKMEVAAVKNDCILSNKLYSLPDDTIANIVTNIEKSNENVICEKKEMLNGSTILQRFYKGKKIFLTGGTGFMGKILIEKLLRSCNGIETIYVLVREKKGKDVYSRIEEILDDPIFERLRYQEPKFRHKIVAVPGDCAVAGLGLSLKDKEMLVTKVDLVFHATATVRFDEKLRLAMAINVHGIRDMMALCRNIKNLKALIHVSTAYSNCHLDYIDEKFHPFPVKYEELEALINNSDDKQLDELLPMILGDWPNTYTFTKALAENMIREQSKGLIMGIFRPAIGTGVLRTIHCDSSYTGNIVPVDLCVNALLSSAWEVANNAAQRQGDDMLIYNYVSQSENPISWQELHDYIFGNYLTHPFSNAIWYQCIFMNKSVAVHKLFMVLLHYIPAILLDGLSLCIGEKPKLLPMYKKLHNLSNIMTYFLQHNLGFSNSNVQSLWNQLEKDDQEMFNFSISCLDWKEYFKNYVQGMRKYLLKQDDSTLEAARRKWKRLYYLHQSVKLTLISVFLYICWVLIGRYIFSLF